MFVYCCACYVVLFMFVYSSLCLHTFVHACILLHMFVYSCACLFTIVHVCVPLCLFVHACVYLNYACLESNLTCTTGFLVMDYMCGSFHEVTCFVVWFLISGYGSLCPVVYPSCIGWWNKVTTFPCSGWLRT